MNAKHSTMRTRVASGYQGLLGAGLVMLASLGLSTTAEAVQSHYQTANLHEFGNSNAVVAGAATLVRTRWHLRSTVNVTDLEPGSAYTLWWVVFNNPEACAGSACGSTDLRNPAVHAAVFYAGGFIADGSGTGRVNAGVRTGRLPEGLDYVDLGTSRRPMVKSGNGLGAEVHLVVRTHGPIIAGEADSQLGSGEFSDCAICANELAATFAPVK